MALRAARPAKLSSDELTFARILLDPVAFAAAFLTQLDGEAAGQPMALWPHQQEDLREPDLQVVHQDGRAVGKTVDIVVQVLHYGVTAQNGRMLVTAPNDGHVNKVIEEVEAHLQNSEFLLETVAVDANGRHRITRKPYYQMTWKNGTIIYFRPAGPTGKSVRGLHCDRVLVDEAAWYPEPAWRALRRVLNRGGQMRAYSNPNGLRNTTYYRITQKGSGWKLFRWPSWIVPGWAEDDTEREARFYGGRSLEFAGYHWRVKGPGWYGPGPNWFSDSQACVSVDFAGRLQLGIRQVGNGWHSSEVALEDSLGYGDYIFTTVGTLDQLDVRAVLGLFLWQYQTCYEGVGSWWNPYNEFDIEFSRWGNPANDIGQFVAQPWDWAGNMDRFDAVFGPEEIASHAIRWLPDRVECRSWRGGPQDEGPETLIHQWTYRGPHVPRPEQPRVHLNLWQVGGSPATEQEVVLETFTFVPWEGSTGLAPPPAGLPHSAALRLQPPVPNPSNPATTLRYTLRTAGTVELEIFDLRGARVRTLAHGPRPAGEHVESWDGRTSAGEPAAGGIYFCRLRQGDQVETQRLLLLP